MFSVFSSYIFSLLACHVFPPSKLYASFDSPLKLSLAFTLRVTLSFVQFVGFPSTLLISGTSLSIFVIDIDEYSFSCPTRSLTFIIMLAVFSSNVFSLLACHVFPPSKL